MIEGKGLSVWTVYDHPSDFPDKVVARCWIGEQPTGSIIIADDIEAIRHQMFDMGLVKLMRCPQDDPVIVEVWL